jgi:hypothetical protein
MYWFEDVLVSLSLVIDGETISKAVIWGIKQGRVNFQIVLMSLFKITFVEVFLNDENTFVKIRKLLVVSMHKFVAMHRLAAVYNCAPVRDSVSVHKFVPCFRLLRSSITSRQLKSDTSQTVAQYQVLKQTTLLWTIELISNLPT